MITKFKNFFSKCLKLCILPTTQCYYFIIIVFFSTIIDFTFSLTEEFRVNQIILGNIFFGYLITLIHTFIQRYKIINITFNLILSTIITIFFIIDIVCHKIFEFFFNRDIAAAIIGSNPSESKEFINMYINMDLIFTILILLFIGIFIFILILKKKNYFNTIFFRNFIIVIFLLSLVQFFVPRWTIRGTIGKIELLLSVQTPPNLKEYFTNPQLIIDESRSPKNVVFILGESLSKSHCSTYGYSKETLPLLKKLKSDNKLYQFENITSPGTNTSLVVKNVFSTFESNNPQNKEWYEHTTLLEILKIAKYKTFWISNQSKKGFYDNIVGNYAELCDISEFAGNKYSGYIRDTKDEVLINMTKPYIQDTTTLNKFFILHLMGSHEQFTSRYPENFNYFKPEDYNFESNDKNYNLATYDNSIIYNDYVINEIIKIFDEQEAIIIYFSDHGLDIYESDPDFIGHARSNRRSQNAAKQIPFYIYLTDKYKERFPEMVNRIKKNCNTEFCTDKSIYMFMDIIGADFKNSPSVYEETLFRHNK